MGVKTASEVFVKNEKVGVAVVGGDPIVTPDPGATIAYLFPVPIHGKSFVNLSIDGEIEHIELTDGMFVIPKTWKKEKKASYRIAFLDAGFTETSYSDGKAQRPEKKVKHYTYFAGHPENTHNAKKEGSVAADIDGESIELELDNGVIVTDNKTVYDFLIAQGFYEAKPPEEILE